MSYQKKKIISGEPPAKPSFDIKMTNIFKTYAKIIISGHAISMINADQYRSMRDQMCGIDTNADQC